MAATYKGCVHDGWEHTELLFEYRGHEYIITKHNNGCMGKTLKQQHEEEQRRIDEMIAHENDPIQEYTGEAEKAFDMFWNYVETGEFK